MRALLAAAVALGAGASGHTRPAGPQVPRFDERVAVSRVLIDVRVLDGRGDPVRGLSAGDFAVRLDGRAAHVETAMWVGAARGNAVPPAGLRAQAAAALEPGTGRLIVFLFQKDLEPSRVIGLMRMLSQSRDLIGTLGPADRIAVLSFDSRLRVWCDFTNDRERLDRILHHGVLFETPAAAQASAGPSLVAGLDPEAARHTYDVEEALRRVAVALEPLPGSKSLVLVGHGFGQLTSAGVMMSRQYGAAAEALVAARTSVFSLDVTDADYHSLEAGLQVVAGDTGGFYARTNLFPGQAIDRLSGALAGYYVLFVEKPERSRRPRRLSVLLTHASGRVLAASRYADALE